MDVPQRHTIKTLNIILFGVFICTLVSIYARGTDAALTSATSIPQTNQNCTTSSGKIITFYVPHSAPNCRTSIEGCVETSKKGLDGVNKPRCLDDVRTGKSKFVTLASDSSNYGRYFCMGNITYTSALDRQKYTVNNVIGYVHDTGGAFRGRPEKIDVCATICEKCSDAQAGALASGRNIGYIPTGAGTPDMANNAFGNNGFNSVLTGQNNPSASAFGGGQQTASNSGGTGGQLGGQPSSSSGGGTPNAPFQPTSQNSFQQSVFQVPQFDTSVTDSGEDAVASITCEDQQVEWSCSEGTKSRALSKPLDIKFITKGNLEGSVRVNPKKTTEYTLQCIKNQKIIGRASCSMNPAVKKTVTKTLQKKAVFSLEVEPARVQRGERSTVSWVAVNVNSCSVSGQGIAENGTEGSVETDRLTERGTSEITLECENSAGDLVTKRVTIIVE